MQASAAKDYLRDQYLEVNPTQFEQLCKLVLEGSERTRELELTPFRQDGGIDIQAVIERDLFWARLGVQVKQYKESQNISISGIQRFKGALFDIDYQIGTYITSSGYTDPAMESAQHSYIRLIDGGDLARIMLESEIGVEKLDSGRWQEDFGFWEAFIEPEEEGVIPTEEVPQADDLKVVELTLEAIDQGFDTKPEVSGFLAENAPESYVPRQGDYYPIAAWVLGLVHKGFETEVDGQTRRQFGLSRRGEEYLEFVHSGRQREAQELLAESIREVEVCDRIIDQIREEGIINHQEMMEIIEKETAISGTTIKRRATTIGNWLDFLPEVKKLKGGGGKPQRYEYHGGGLDSWTG